MNLQEIKNALNEGKKVYWANTNYEVIKDNLNQYFIKSKSNNNYNYNYIGLYYDTDKLNGKEEHFFIGE